MASTTQHLLLSPAELAYLHSALRLTPPVRPDGRTATQFRPLTAETGVLPGTNGSARRGGNEQRAPPSLRADDRPPVAINRAGVPNAVNAAAWGGQGAPAAKDPGARAAEIDNVEGVWKPPRGGAKVATLGAMVQKVLEKGGIADEVLEGLDAVDLG
ncbi:hypothetical protein K449DRAFT_398645 [Hypoxylon sp. EC38]|nr:hypothetical protein K449DRAFT_398645 [Hypoxylon sp. EC38]